MKPTATTAYLWFTMVTANKMIYSKKEMIRTIDECHRKTQIEFIIKNVYSIWKEKERRGERQS